VDARGKGVVINGPSVIARDTMKGEVAAVGLEAKTLARRLPREIRLERPIRDGVIADCEAAGQMLSQFIRRVVTHRSLAGLSLLICAPAEVTPLEQRAYEDAAGRAGARKVRLIEEPYAAAIGPGLNLQPARAPLLISRGAATTDVAVISGGGMLYASTRRVGGDEIDRAVARYLQLERALEVSEETAEEVKIELGAVDTQRDRRTIAVR